MYWGWRCVHTRLKYKFMLKVIIFYPVPGKSSIENSISLSGGSSGIWKITRFSKHSTTTWWVDNQSITKMASKSCISREIKSATIWIISTLITHLWNTLSANNNSPTSVATILRLWLPILLPTNEDIEFYKELYLCLFADIGQMAIPLTI